MDIVLKEDDVKRLVADALGMEVPPEDMTVVKDPFTVTIANAELYLKKFKKPDLPRKDTEPNEELREEEGESSPSDDDSPLLSIDELHRQSAGIADMPPSTGSDAKRALKRPLRANETDMVPPPTERGREK